MFPTKFNKERASFSEAGTRFKKVYELQSDEDGVITLRKTGEKNLYDEIQSHAESVDINNILARFQNGDVTALGTPRGEYIDITDMPTNFRDLMNVVITDENDFNKLPLEVRRAYNFSASEYISDIGSDKWASLLGLKEDKKEDDVIVPFDDLEKGVDEDE